MARNGPLRRHAVRFLDELARRRWGFVPELASFLVTEMGLVRAVIWFTGNLLRYEVALRTLGPLRTHLVGLTVSLVRGCRFAAVGHSYALELVYLRDHNRLLPVSAGTICEWTGLSPKEVRTRLAEVLQRAGLPLEVLWVDRTITLLEGAQPPIDKSEVRVYHLARMMEMLAAAGLAGAPAPDEEREDSEANGRNAETGLPVRSPRLPTPTTRARVEASRPQTAVA
mgnify:CR=1 FL=1